MKPMEKGLFLKMDPRRGRGNGTNGPNLKILKRRLLIPIVTAWGSANCYVQALSQLALTSGPPEPS
jgi:hypothetical protein